MRYTRVNLLSLFGLGIKPCFTLKSFALSLKNWQVLKLYYQPNPDFNKKFCQFQTGFYLGKVNVQLFMFRQHLSFKI